MIDMEIRLANPSETQKLEDFFVLSDGEEWRELAHKYIASSFSQDFRRPVFLVAVEKDGIIGSAAFSEELFTYGTWGISWVNVHPAWRGQGIGKKLVLACLAEIQKNIDKKVTVILNTYPKKTGIYDKTGFREMGNDHEGGSFMVRYLETGTAL